MLPSPDFPYDYYDEPGGRQRAHARALVAAAIILIICMFVLARLSGCA